MEIVTFCFKMTLYGKAEHAFLIGRCVYVHIKLVFFVLLHAVAEYNQIFVIPVMVSPVSSGLRIDNESPTLNT